MLSLGLRLKEIVRAVDVSQKELAELLGLSENGIGNYVKGKRSPDAVILSKIIQMYNINANWLLTGTGSMFLEPLPNTGIHCPNCGSKLKITIDKE